MIVRFGMFLLCVVWFVSLAGCYKAAPANVGAEEVVGSADPADLSVWVGTWEAAQTNFVTGEWLTIKFEGAVLTGTHKVHAGEDLDFYTMKDIQANRKKLRFWIKEKDVTVTAGGLEDQGANLVADAIAPEKPRYDYVLEMSDDGNSAKVIAHRMDRQGPEWYTSADGTYIFRRKTPPVPPPPPVVID